LMRGASTLLPHVSEISFPIQKCVEFGRLGELDLVDPAGTLGVFIDESRLPPPFANTPVKHRPTIAAAYHHRSCDIDRCVYEAQRSPLAFRAENKNSNLIAAYLPISIPITEVPELSLRDMGMLLIFGAPCQLRLLAGPSTAGPSYWRTRRD